MDNKTALRIANDFLRDMNPDMWNGKGSVVPDNLDTRIWEERNIFDDVALWINFESPDENDDNEWYTYIELRDHPDDDDPYCLEITSVYGIDSPQNIADGIMEICGRCGK